MLSKRRESFKNKDIFFEADYEAVFRYILSLCRNEAEAQDITQDTFLKAIQAGKDFQGKISVYTWLCAIAKNIWFDRLRKQKRLVPIEEELQGQGSSIEEKIVNEDTAMQVHKVLHEMKEPYKEVFSLRYLDNYLLQRLQGYLVRPKAGHG